MRAQMGAAQKLFSDMEPQAANGNGHAASPESTFSHNAPSTEIRSHSPMGSHPPPLETDAFSDL
jgi:hypothetical protein